MPRPPIQQIADAHDIGDLPHAVVLIGFGDLLQFQWISDILKNGHVRVQGVALEDHADVAVFRLHLIDNAIAEADDAVGRLVNAGQGQQRGRLAAAGGPEESHELAVFDVQRQILDADHIAELLGEIVNRDSHGNPLFRQALSS